MPPGRTRYHEGSSNTGVYLTETREGREALRDKLFQAANRKIEKNQWGNYDAKYDVECERHLVVVDESMASAKSMGDYFLEERTRTHGEGTEPPARPSFLLEGLHLPRIPFDPVVPGASTRLGVADSQGGASRNHSFGTGSDRCLLHDPAQTRC